MVDMWGPQDHYRQMDSAPLEENLRRMDVARQQVAPHASKAVLLRNASTVAAASFADSSVDFVYLDARHDYLGVLQDLRSWWPKLALGGVMAGHDYSWQREPRDAVEARQDPHTQRQDWTLNFDGSVEAAGRTRRPPYQHETEV